MAARPVAAVAARPVAAVPARSGAAPSVAARSAARPAAVAHLGDIAACAKFHDLTADAEKIGSNGLNSRFSQGRFGSNWEVDARIGEVCFGPISGLRQSGLSGPKVRGWAHAPRQTTCTNRSNLFNHIVGAGE